jgi:hypothetical protein
MASTKIASQTIVYSFENAQITTSGGDTFYEADIAITTDTDFELGSGQFYLDYNTDAFGFDIFQNNLTFGHPDGGTYVLDEKIFGGALDAYDPIIANTTNSKLSIAWVAAVSNQVSTNITVANSPNLICHIKIRFDDANEDPMISFDDQLPTSSQGLTHIDGTPEIQLNSDTYDSSGAVIASVNTWTGATSIDWDTATNWSLGTVPTGTTDVVIPTGTSQPRASSGASVNKLTIETGASVNIVGNLTNNDTSIIQNGGSLVITGTSSNPVTYYRTLTTNNWYLMTSPVSDQGVVNFTTNNSLALGSGSNTTQNIALATYDNTQVAINDRWDYYTVGQVDGIGGDDTSDILNPAQGYAVKLNSPADIAFTGMINQNNYVQISTSVGSGNNSFNLIGNPFPAYVSVNDNASVSNIIKTNTISRQVLTEATIWLWDQSLNTGSGAYFAVNQASPARYLAPGQGFFISATGGAGVGSLFAMIGSHQSHQTTDTFYRASNTRPEIKLTIGNGTGTSFTDIYYIEGTTLGFDNGYDSTTFGGASNDFEVYTHLLADSQGENLAIQSLPDSDFESMVIPLGVNAVSGTVLVFTAESINIPNGLDVILEDRDQGVFTTLSDANAQYSVTLANDSNGIGRFYLHTNTQATLSVSNQELTNVSVYKTTASNLRITGIDTGRVSIQLYNLLGQSVFKTSFEGASVNDITLPNLKTGIYIVDIHSEKGQLNKKIILK